MGLSWPECSGERLLGAFLALITFHRAKHESRNSVFYNYCQLVVVVSIPIRSWVRVANQEGVGEGGYLTRGVTHSQKTCSRSDR